MGSWRGCWRAARLLKQDVGDDQTISLSQALLRFLMYASRSRSLIRIIVSVILGQLLSLINSRLGQAWSGLVRERLIG